MLDVILAVALTIGMIVQVVGAVAAFMAGAALIFIGAAYAHFFLKYMRDTDG